MKSRQRIENECKRLGLKIISLSYDPSIQYDSGGWNLDIESPVNPSERIGYGCHHADQVISDLKRGWDYEEEAPHD